MEALAIYDALCIKPKPDSERVYFVARSTGKRLLKTDGGIENVRLYCTCFELANGSEFFAASTRGFSRKGQRDT